MSICTACSCASSNAATRSGSEYTMSAAILDMAPPRARTRLQSATVIDLPSTSPIVYFGDAVARSLACRVSWMARNRPASDSITPLP